MTDAFFEEIQKENERVSVSVSATTPIHWNHPASGGVSSALRWQERLTVAELYLSTSSCRNQRRENAVMNTKIQSTYKSITYKCCGEHLSDSKR